MALTPFTSTIAASTFNSNFDDKLAALAAANAEGRKDTVIVYYLQSLDAAADLRDRSIAWTAPDDAQIRIAFARVRDSGVRELTMTLTVEGGDEDYLNGETVSVVIATANGTVDTRTAGSLNYTSSWLQVRKGVRYRLTLANSATGLIGGPLRSGVQVRTRRRDA
jgi:hypothetical protein